MPRHRNPTKREKLAHRQTPAAAFATNAWYAFDLILNKGLNGYARNYCCSAMTLIGGPFTPLGNWLKNKHFATEAKFSSDMRKQLLREFSLSYTAETLQPIIEIADRFEAGHTKRITKFNGFNEIRTTANERFGDRLQAPNQAATNVKNQIDAALRGITVISDVGAKLKAAKTLAQDDKATDNPLSVAQTISEIYAQVTQQLEAEQAAITDLFTHPDFVRDLKETLGGPETPDEQVEHIKEEMLKAMKANHDKALDVDKTKEQLDKLKKEAERAADELYLISLLFTEGSQAMHQRISALKHRPPAQVVVGGLDEDSLASELHGVTLKKLGNLDLFGVELKGTGNGYTLTFPSNWDPFYQNPDEQIFAALQMQALAMKALGIEEIVITVHDQSSKEDHEAHKARLDMAKKAYKACRFMGFPQAKITIKHNNESITPAQLFGGALGAVEDEANSKQQKIAQDMKSDQHRLTDTYKRRLLTQTEKDQRAAAAAPPPGPGVPRRP